MTDFYPYFYDWNEADYLLRIPFWSDVQVGDLVVVQDGDIDLCEVRIIEITTPPRNGSEPKDRAYGWAKFEPLWETWVDGSDVVTLAMNWVRQTTRNHPVRTPSLSPTASEES